jgi:hypothetical protein
MIQTSKGKSEATAFDELATSQSVGPVTEFDALLGHSSDEDESLEDFCAMLRDWRREGPKPTPQP